MWHSYRLTCTTQSKDVKDKKKKVDKAVVNYMTFLCEGCRVILEDTAILQDLDPNDRLFKLPCFQTDGQQGTELQQKWKSYKDAVIAAHGRTVDDHLTVCMLVLSSSLCLSQYFACLLAVAMVMKLVRHEILQHARTVSKTLRHASAYTKG